MTFTADSIVIFFSSASTSVPGCRPSFRSASAAHCRTRESSSSFIAAVRASTARLSPRLPSACATELRTYRSSSLSATMSGSTARRSPILPSAEAASARTLESPSFNRSISRSNSAPRCWLDDSSPKR